MAATMLNGSAGTDANAVNNSMSVPGKQPPKQSFANKVIDGGRKQIGNPSDVSQRRAPQKAWQSGMNPLTQRSSNPSQPNGIPSQHRGLGAKPMTNRETGTPDRHAHDRLLALYANAMGLPASVTVKNGDIFKGIFYGTTLESPESAYLLKMVQQHKMGNKAEVNRTQENFCDYIGIGEDYAMTFDVKDVIDLAFEGVIFSAQNAMANGSNTTFRTDADISGNLAIRERDLQRWEPSTTTNVDMSLDSSGGAWDQFQVNEQLFGVKSDYDENIYTTRIDRSTPDYPQREAEAQRIARHIEGAAASNAHIREERGILHDDDGVDEEEKYSGVSRQPQDYPPLQSGQNNRYMAPARRLPTSKATVSGAPVDPAIITSQVARSGNNQQGASSTSSTQSRSENDSVGSTSAAPAEQSKNAGKAPMPVEQATTSSRRPSNSTKGPIPSDSATANVEANLLDSFRNFANLEKMKVSDHRRQRVSQDKAVKLNDLMKFSQNFKLHTPVPKDLVPILAKDKSKQEEIIERAQRNAQKPSNAVSKPTPPDSEQKPLKAVPEGPRDSSQHVAKPGDRREYPLAHHGYPSQGSQASLTMRDGPPQLHSTPLSPPKSGSGLLSHRLADSHRQHKAGMQISVPHPLPINQGSRSSTRSTANVAPISTSQTPSSVRTPTSAVSSKFNIKAPEFKPNPAANSFKPVGAPSTISSPMSTPGARPASRAPTPTAFFGERKPLPATERPSILQNFNPIKRLKEKAEEEGKAKDYSANGGIKYAYTTTPVWTEIRDENDQRSYKDMFDGPAPASGKASPQPVHQVSQTVPHQHQLPQHLQQPSHGTPHLHAPPHQAPFSVQPPVQHYQHGQHPYDDHRAHLSTSNPSVYPSPRMQNNAMAYPSPMQQPAQLAFGQPMPQYVMAASGPQPAHFRQFPGAPQLVPAQGPQLAAPMMVQQSSQGSFVGPPHSMAVPFNPQIPMYPPGQGPTYGQSQPPSGYPSPGRGAPMMTHQGSHQGQQPMYMTPSQYGQPVYAQQQPPHMMPMRAYGSPQPHYAQSPQPQYHYPPQPPHRIPSYGQPPHAQHQHHHQPMHHTAPNVPVEHSEEAK